MKTFSPLTARLQLDESLVADFPSILAFLGFATCSSVFQVTCLPKLIYFAMVECTMFPALKIECIFNTIHKNAVLFNEVNKQYAPYAHIY
jgi:hypothetical protein